MTRHLPVVESDERFAERYAIRKRLADQQRAELEAAIAAIGPGREGYCKWILFDKLGIEQPCVTYGYADGSGWQGCPPAPEERVEREVVTFVTESGIKYEVHSKPINGTTYYPFRWSLGFAALELYRPQTPEQMKAAAERRRDAALAKQQAEEAKREEARRSEAERQPDLLAWAGIDKDGGQP